MPAALAPPRPGTPLSPPCPRRASAPAAGPRCCDDAVIGIALTTTWMLITGRFLDHEPLLHGLPAADLIDFWADDFARADGRDVAKRHAESCGRP
jgi:hypothetical protein